MVGWRYQAQLKRDFETAHEIRKHLRTTYNVAIDDTNEEWYVHNDEYILAGRHDFSPYQAAVTKERLRKIHVYRANKEKGLKIFEG